MAWAGEACPCDERARRYGSPPDGEIPVKRPTARGTLAARPPLSRARRGAPARGGAAPAPRGVVRDPGLEQPPERGRVPEHPQVAQLVGGDRVEGAGGARMSRQLNESAPRREQLPQRDVVSRIVMLLGTTPSPGPWRAIASSRAARARARNHASSTSAVSRRSLATRSTSSSSPSSAPTLETRDERRPAGAATTRMRWGSPRYGTRRPSSTWGRSSSRDRVASWRSRWPRIQSSRSARNRSTSASG